MSIDAPVFVVEGRTDDPDVKEIALVTNDRRTLVPVRGGRFRKILPVLEPQIRVWAESLETSLRSEMVTIRNTAPVTPSAVLVLDAAPDVALADWSMSGRWRSAPDRVDAPTSAVTLTAIVTSDGPGAQAFHARNLASGVHTFVVTRVEAGSPPDTRPVLYLARNGVVTTHPLRALSGAGRQIVARLLLPQGVFWEQDDWFSGRSESTETITKFRFPDGVTWVERKHDSP